MSSRSAWTPIVVMLALHAGCGARTDVDLASANDGHGGASGRDGSGAAGGAAGTSAGRQGGSGVGGTGVAGTGVGGAFGPGGVGGRTNQGGADAGSAQGGIAGQAGRAPAGGAGGFGGLAGGGAAGSGASAGSGGLSGNAGSAGEGGFGGAGEGGTGAQSGEGGEGGVAGSAPAASVLAIGAFHTCAGFVDGSLRCWGSAGYIGSADDVTIGDDETPSTIPPVSIGGSVESIAAGWYHTCAVLARGNVRCFGVAADGRLGYGNLEDIGDDELPSSASDVDIGVRVSQLSAGPQHTCARLINGKVRCWGVNSNFQLGYADPEPIGDDETPASAGDVDVGGRVLQVVVGFSHTCALLEGGTVRCWGSGSGGRLGYGNTETIGDDESPRDAGDIDLGGEAVALAAGALHTCALLATGNVRCWGTPINGVLGYGNLDTIGDDETPAQAGDVQVGGTVVEIAAGDYATCVRLVGGAVRCWGRAEEGQLGYASGDLEDIGDDETPDSAGDIDLGGPAAHIDVGFLNVCAILESGGVRCWGRGQTGALGYGNLDDVGDDETPASAGDVKTWP